MNPSSISISIFSAVAAAAWSVWTWQLEQQKLRELKRDVMSAQYINTFILTTQELQRKLYKILEKDELSFYRLKYSQPIEPASPVALDLLYHMSIFFGWGLITFRFGPYTRDSKMIAIMAQIRETLESRSRFPGDAFRFTLSDRLALGDSVVRRVGENAHGPAFVSISRFKFAEDVADEHNERASLFGSDEVRCTLEAIDRALRGEPLEGRERLIVLQNQLVDLVAYLEKAEGFRVSVGERARASHRKHADVRSNDVCILHQMPGRIRLGVPHLRVDKASAARLQLQLVSLNHVDSVRVNGDAACIVVQYSKDVCEAEFINSVVTLVEAELGRTSGVDSLASSAH